jgi:hypothetical protein
MTRRPTTDREPVSPPAPASSERAGFWTDHRISRRDTLVRLGSAAAGTLALAMTGLPRVAVASPSPPVAPPAAFSAEIAARWFETVLDLVRTTPGFSPPVAARAFGYLGVTLYEALVPGMTGYRSLAGQVSGLTPLPPPGDPAYHWPTVANSALAALARSLFPTTSSANLAVIDVLESAFAQAFKAIVPAGIHERSVKRGRSVAGHIFAWSTTDGGHAGYLTNFPSSYTPPAGPGLWTPTPPGFLRALQPYWGSNRPFVVTLGECDPGPHVPAYSESQDSDFHMVASEVYHTVNHLTPEQRAIALFWADDPGLTATPPGHSISILTQFLRRMEAGLDLAAEAYAKVGIAVADSFIACWSTKYRYNLLRPITFVQRVIDPAWGNPLPLTTPPFPEYTSGHSVQSGAVAQVLSDLFGDFPFTDHTHDARGFAPRSFASCLAMAEEAAISRLYGGIHFRPAIELGIDQGRCIGRKVSTLVFSDRRSMIGIG